MLVFGFVMNNSKCRYQLLFSPNNTAPPENYIRNFGPLRTDPKHLFWSSPEIHAQYDLLTSFDLKACQIQNEISDLS